MATSKSPPPTDAEPGESRAGFVALIGAPNSGKSTLLNALVGAKVSIVSPKVQTTRARVLGIAIEDDAQIVFVDTPGIFAPRKRLDRAMVNAAWQAAEDADVSALLLDAPRAARAQDDGSEKIAARLGERRGQALLVLNKIDLMRPPPLLALAERFNAVGRFAAT